MRDPETVLAALERLHRQAVMVYDRANATGNEPVATLAGLDVVGLSEAIEMAKRMVPTPPVLKKGRWFTIARCPECDKAFPTGEKPNYCQNCGKAVFWNDEKGEG